MANSASKILQAVIKDGTVGQEIHFTVETKGWCQHQDRSITQGHMVHVTRQVKTSKLS